MPTQFRGRRTAFVVATLAVLAASAPLEAVAAPKPQPLVSRSQSENAVVTVKAVDMATRHLTILRGTGETMTVKVPPDFERLGELKPGDRIKATYTLETEIGLTTRGAAHPKDDVSIGSARTVSGGPPSATIAGAVTVTGAVLAIDNAKHTIKIVSPSGGEVHTVEITRPEGRAAMSKLKVGDKITATVTESVLLSVSPA